MELDSTQRARRTTTKLLVGPLSRGRGQKRKRGEEILNRVTVRKENMLGRKDV